MLDFAIDTQKIEHKTVHSQVFDSDRYVCIVREDHPIADKKLTLERYLSLRHIHTSNRSKGAGMIDTALELIGKKRSIAMRIPHYLSTIPLIENLDLCAEVPYALINKHHQVKVFELPFQVPLVHAFLHWNRRFEQDPASVWIRDQILTSNRKN